MDILGAIFWTLVSALFSLTNAMGIMLFVIDGNKNNPDFHKETGMLIFFIVLFTHIHLFEPFLKKQYASISKG